MIFTRLHSAALTPAHMGWLRELCSLSNKGYTPLDLIKDEVAGTRQFFDADGLGIVVTEILGHPGGRELYVWGAAGDGLTRRGQMLALELKMQARLWNCRWVGFRASKTALCRFYERCWKTAPEGNFYSVEVS